MTLEEFNSAIQRVLLKYQKELINSKWGYEGYGFTRAYDSSGSHIFNFRKAGIIENYICLDDGGKTLIIRSEILNKDNEIYDYDMFVRIGNDLLNIFMADERSEIKAAAVGF